MPREAERNYAIISVRIFDFLGSANLVPSQLLVSGAPCIHVRNYVRLIKHYNWQLAETR